MKGHKTDTGKKDRSLTVNMDFGMFPHVVFADGSLSTGFANPFLPFTVNVGVHDCGDSDLCPIHHKIRSIVGTSVESWGLSLGRSVSVLLRRDEFINNSYGIFIHFLNFHLLFSLPLGPNFNWEWDERIRFGERIIQTSNIINFYVQSSGCPKFLENNVFNISFF